MAGLAELWPRVAAVVEAAVGALGGGWSFHPVPPDAASPPAVWLERGRAETAIDDPHLGEVDFTVIGAFANRPALPTLTAEYDLIDAIEAATNANAMSGLHRRGFSCDPAGSLELGGTSYRAVSIHVTVVYPLC